GSLQSLERTPGEKLMTSIAIIGAGCSGLAAAHTLLDAGYTVTLFEKSRDVGGRATTRKRNGFIYDSGAQYIKPGSPDSISLITLAQCMAEGLDIQFETSIHHVEQTLAGWKLFDETGQLRGQFERLLITLPAPLAHELIQASQCDDDLCNAICFQLDKAYYNP